tara:strand:- start:1 stop:489 length:489 start_codon:yes stop_codon:yes gene_type:complete
MNLKEIKDYEGLYSFDLNTNQVYSHIRKKYLKPRVNEFGYYRIKFTKPKIKIFTYHRIIYEAHNGTIPDKMEIDHINNDKSNNHISNLRLCSSSENSFNRKVQKNNKSGYKNIQLTKNNTYKVKISKNIKTVYSKTFKTLEEAILNRNVQLVLIHGEFHNLG